jgi:RimJ/RimL family protein N-acetyltransferase
MDMRFDNYSIRLLSTEDVDAYFELVKRNRKRLEDFFTGTVSKTGTLESTREFVLDMMNRTKERTYFPYLLVDDTDQKIIGFFDLKNIDWNIPKSEVGCYIDERYAGKGLVTKAFGLFCDFCFTEFNFSKLFLRTHHSNSSARRVAEKCGFEIEGTIRRDYKTSSGALVDLIYYGRLN